jgi:hypothetical protein
VAVKEDKEPFRNDVNAFHLYWFFIGLIQNYFEAAKL